MVTAKEFQLMLDDVGFQVTEDYQLNDLSEVKEDRQNVPAASNVLLRISACTSRKSKDGSIKSVALQFHLVEGVEVADPQTGTIVRKYANKVLFADLPYWVDTAIRNTPRYLSAKQPFLVPLKQWLSALGYDVKTPPKLGDEFYSSVLGRELRADVKLREIRVKAPDGQWVGTGEYKNEVVNFRSV